MIKELSDPFVEIGHHNPVWPKIRRFLGRQKRRMFPNLEATSMRPIFGFTQGATTPLKKRALLIYLSNAFYDDPHKLQRNGFVTALQSLEIAKAFNRLGYIVDVVDYRDDMFVPSTHYDVCFGMHQNFGRLLPMLAKDKTVNIYYATGVYWEVENVAEDARCQSLKVRRGIKARLPTRLAPNNWVQAADAVVAQGNEFVLRPYRVHNPRVFGIEHSATHTTPPNFDVKDFAGSARQNFLWFGSIGLLHKGLDVVLEAFSSLEDLHLWVCGPLQSQDEREFVKLYSKELFHTANIHPIGWINIRSQEFLELTDKCVAAIHASCADSMPGCVLNCMARGLIPLVSRESGMDTDGFGITLEESSVPEIRRVVSEIANTPADVCRSMAEEAYREACTRYTLDVFRSNIEHTLATILNDKANNCVPIPDARDSFDYQPSPSSSR
jgi:glycosyltransferase involved in cell wall biosynthesis